MDEPDEMSPELLQAIRARLDEPPPWLALAERRRGRTALFKYLDRLQRDRISLVEEVDPLRAELGSAASEPSRPADTDSSRPGDTE